MGQLAKALKYPFLRFQGLFNFYWYLIPVLGSIIFFGYLVTMARSIYDRRELEGLPRFDEVSFEDTLLHGVFIFLGQLIAGLGIYIIILIFIAIGVVFSETVAYNSAYGSLMTGLIMILLFAVSSFFIITGTVMLPFQYAHTLKFTDAINVLKSWNIVFGNFRKFLGAFFRSLFISFIYLILPALILFGIYFVSFIVIPSIVIVSVILIIISFFLLIFVVSPPVIFSQYYLFADFYRDIYNLVSKKRSKKILN